MATIFDVARAAAVSHQTVSRVLKGDPTVGPALRERVEAAVRDLRYRPSAAARALASRRTRTLGMITVGQPYFGPSSTAHGFNAAARGAGWDVTIEALDRSDGGDVGQAVDALRSRDVQAVVVVAPTPEVLAEVVAADREVPFVVAGPGGDGISGVAMDQEAAGFAAAAHLTGLGHRGVAHVAGPADWLDAQDREHGWRRAIAGAGLPDGPLMRGDWSPGSGAAAARDLIAFGATAVFCANDQMALGLLHELHAAGLRVPGDLSLVGFDDIPEAAYFTPALTTMRQDFVTLGRRLLERVEELVRLDPPATRAVPTALPTPPPVPELVVRASTALR